MPTWVHEWIVAPLAFALALRHAARALGARRAIGEMLVLTAYGYVLEWMAMALFAAYRYSPTWVVAPAGVPVAIAMMWAAIIVAAIALAERAGAASALGRAATAASLAIALDLLMEPVASRLDLWQWTPAGPWLAVPIGNFVGWAVIVGGYTFGAERSRDDGQGRRSVLRRLGLAAGAVAALMLVGALWRGLHLERLFHSGRGWIGWAVLITAPVVLSLRNGGCARSGASTFGERLGGQAGRGPELVFLVIVATFAADVISLRDARLATIAVATACSLTVALRPRRRVALLE
jgi:hypothetical protein